MVKKVSQLCFVLILGVALAGCSGDGGGSSNKDPQPPDGPDVILGPDNGNLKWTIGGSSATAGNSIFDATHKDTYCKLRKDFRGVKTNKFKYQPKSGGAMKDAGTIFLESDDIQLTIRDEGGAGLEWHIENTSTNESCTLEEGAVPSPITKVPAEFIGLKHSRPADKFEEAITKDAAESIEFQVQY